MRIATFNCNSIRTRMQVVLGWLARHRPDVLCLQETKVQDAEFPRQALEAAGYVVTYRGMKAYNGVAILSRVPPDEIHFGFADGGPSDEARLACARFGRLHILNTYVPQGRAIDHAMFRYKIEWFARLRRHVEQRWTTSDRVVWLGDCNVAAEPIDVHDPEARAQHVCFHAAARAAFAACRAWGFADVFRQFHPEPGHYTFFDYRTAFRGPVGEGWRIDYILASTAMARAAVDCWIDMGPRLQPRPSDHTFLAADFV